MKKVLYQRKEVTRPFLANKKPSFSSRQFPQREMTSREAAFFNRQLDEKLKIVLQSVLDAKPTKLSDPEKYFANYPERLRE